MHTEEAQQSPTQSLRRWVVLWVVLLAIPLVPFTIMMSMGHDPFAAWVESVRERATAAAIVCFILLASDVLLPVPSSLVALVSGQALGAAGGGLLNWVAITLGHLIGFALARRWGRPIAERFIGAEGLARAGGAWERGATVGLILSRPVPVLAEALSMFAGLTAFSPWRFALIAGLANLPHSFIYSWAGANIRDLQSLNVLVAAGVGAPAVAYLLFALWRRGVQNS